MTDHVCSPGCNHHSHIGENEKGEFAAGKEKVLAATKAAVAKGWADAKAGREKVEADAEDCPWHGMWPPTKWPRWQHLAATFENVD